MLVAATLLGIHLPTASNSADSQRELLCLAANIYFEARGETYIGQVAVKDVTVNRGRGFCNTVFKRGQFSWTKTHKWAVINSFLVDKPKNLSKADTKAWTLAKEVAMSSVTVLPKSYKHYHTLSVKPAWSKSGIVIGNHKFMEGVR